jgi:outer membrane transport energization protein ExbB (TC 2.C.1.1.1)
MFFFSNDLQNFLQAGGPVLLVLMGVAVTLWVLILERVLYFNFAHRGVVDEALRQWMSRSDRSSWHAAQIREQLISQVRIKAEQNVILLKTVVSVCPLFGLLGTVTGMVEVFDVMAITGSSNARAMSAGVSKATIPTMVGMVIALSGILVTSGIDKRVSRRIQALGDQMQSH